MEDVYIDKTDNPNVIDLCIPRMDPDWPSWPGAWDPEIYSTEDISGMTDWDVYEIIEELEKRNPGVRIHKDLESYNWYMDCVDEAAYDAYIDHRIDEMWDGSLDNWND